MNMKRKTAVILAVSVLMLLCCAAAAAETSGKLNSNLSWQLNDDGTLFIWGTGDIPDYNLSYNGSPFEAKDTVKKVYIDEGVTRIGRYLFYNCAKLTEVNLPAGLISIGRNAFTGTGVKDVTIPYSVSSLEDWAFENCTSLWRVTVLNSQMAFGQDVFKGHKANEPLLCCFTESTAKTYAKEYSVRTSHPFCGDRVFFDITPDGRLIISYDRADAKMSDFTDNPPWYDQRANITEVDYSTSKQSYYLSNVGATAFWDMPNLVTVRLPDSVTSIGDNAFQNCPMLSEFTIPDGVTSIGTAAFSGCSCLDVEIPSGIKFIGDYAFHNCYSLRKVSIPLSTTRIGMEAFYGCANLSKVAIYSDSAEIGRNAFGGCSPDLLMRGFRYSTTETYANANGISFKVIGLSGTCGQNAKFNLDISTGKVTISGTGYMIGYEPSISPSPISENDLVKSVEIESGILNIGKNYFYGCRNLTTVSIPDTVTSIDDGAFFGTGLREVHFPDSVKYIRASAFEDCTKLKEVTLPQNLFSLGQYAFAGCTSLENMTIPRSDPAIQSYAFYDCENLKELLIYSKKASIHDDICLDCPEELVIKGYLGSTAETYARENGHTFVPILRKPDLVLPNDLTTIEAEAFAGVGAKVIYLPDTVTKIGSKAFMNCPNLVEIRIPASVTVIPSDLFDGIPTTRLTIAGEKGSAAENFANKKHYTFVEE